MTVLVDHRLTIDAATDPVTAYLLGMIFAWGHGVTPSMPVFKRFWYLDEGPPEEVEPPPPGVGEKFVTTWMWIEWSGQDELPSVTYQLGDNVHSGRLWVQRELLDRIQDKAPPDSYASLPDPHGQMRMDLLAAWAARDLPADVFVTNRDFLFATPYVGRLDTFILRPAEAVPLIGLYLRQQERFVTSATADGRYITATSRTGFYAMAVHGLVPTLRWWQTAFRQHADAAKDAKLLWLTDTLVHRLGAAIAARDRLHATLFQPQEDQIQDEVLADLDQVNLLLMAAFDNAAGVAHITLGLKSSVREAAWQRDRWVKKVAALQPGLARLVEPGTDGLHLLTVLAAFRNTIHGELASLMIYQYSSQPLDTRVALPRDEAQDVLDAMDALGGREAWGVDQQGASEPMDTFIRPGPFVEQLLRCASKLLDGLLAATPVERLKGVNLNLGEPVQSAEPISASSARTGEQGQRVRWQLGLKGL
jgi:hypothetical protein